MTDITKELVQGRHVIVLDENNQIHKGENNKVLIYDNIIGTLTEVPLSPEVISFFNLPIEDKTQISTEKTQVQNLSLYNDGNSSSNDSSKLCATWDDKSVKLLFTLYKDHQDAFKSTSIKNEVVWDKIRMQMKTDKGYNFTRQQIKDKWTNMKKNYLRVKDHNKMTGAAPKTYRYYDEMDDLFGDKPNVNPVATSSNMRANDQNMSMDDDDIKESNQHKVKKSKVERQLSSWTDKFIQHTKEKDDRREQHQKEKIDAINNATETFRNTMEKLIEKL
ncbi:PREDICTED: uncharacterized protein LOC108774326 [Cyphomyrmex costatus]|uniref:uncharacterized protein LOC108774326 n=1 Tax=Cyphomyrmex costatus TaxID=456900 RepID=UPI0008523C0B|nr:PREDICTED: uncharacterized protein LOC108774326 [Cyphomyrmex costatus]